MTTYYTIYELVAVDSIQKYAETSYERKERVVLEKISDGFRSMEEALGEIEGDKEKYRYKDITILPSDNKGFHEIRNSCN